METPNHKINPKEEFPDFDKADKLNKKTYPVGKKKLKNIKMFEEFVLKKNK